MVGGGGDSFALKGEGEFPGFKPFFNFLLSIARYAGIY